MLINMVKTPVRKHLIGKIMEHQLSYSQHRVLMSAFFTGQFEY